MSHPTPKRRVSAALNAATMRHGIPVSSSSQLAPGFALCAIRQTPSQPLLSNPRPARCSANAIDDVPSYDIRAPLEVARREKLFFVGECQDHVGDFVPE